MNLIIVVIRVPEHRVRTVGLNQLEVRMNQPQIKPHSLEIQPVVQSRERPSVRAESR